MKAKNRFANQCPSCGSFDTGLVTDEYRAFRNADGLNALEESRECNECGFDYWNVFVLVRQENADGNEL